MEGHVETSGSGPKDVFTNVFGGEICMMSSGPVARNDS